MTRLREVGRLQLPLQLTDFENHLPVLDTKQNLIGISLSVIYTMRGICLFVMLRGLVSEIKADRMYNGFFKKCKKNESGVLEMR